MVMTHICTPSTREVVVGERELQIHNQPGLEQEKLNTFTS